MRVDGVQCQLSHTTSTGAPPPHTRMLPLRLTCPSSAGMPKGTKLSDVIAATFSGSCSASTWSFQVIHLHTHKYVTHERV
jgi:hypothetical protein